MLEINTGEHRYVVAYTLKSASECAEGDRQPDILNTPRGEDIYLMFPFFIRRVMLHHKIERHLTAACLY